MYCESRSILCPQSRGSDGREGFVYDAVECFSSVWDQGTRVETNLGGGEGLAKAGFLIDPSKGNVSYLKSWYVFHVAQPVLFSIWVRQEGLLQRKFSRPVLLLGWHI